MIKAGYKETELGEIPEEWEIVELNNVADYYNGYPFEPTQWETYGTPIIRIQNLTGSSNVINYFNGLLESRYHISNGDLLLSWSATLNVFIWRGGDAYLNQHIFKVLPKKNIDKMYLYNVLGIVISKLKNEVHGSTMKHFVKSALSLVNVPVPPFYEQQKIAKILLNTDALISALDEIIAKKENIKTGLMQELLTKGIGHSKFKDTKIGRIPKEWEIKKIKDISTYITDGTHKTPNYVKYSQSSIPFISTENIQPYSYEFNFSRYKRYIDEISCIELSKRANTEKGDLLISKCGTIGRTQLIRKNFKIGIFVGLLLLKINYNVVNGQYLEYLLNWEKFRKIMESNSSGSTRKTLAISIFKDMSISIPPLEEQKKIADILSDIQQEIQALEQKREKYKMIKSGLMQQLLTGKVRVK